MSQWHATDLTAIADWLRPRRTRTRLVGLSDKAAAAGTIRKDLAEAERCIAEIERLQAAHGDPGTDVEQQEGTVTGALFSHAVVPYARATFTSSKQRQSLLGEDHLTPNSAPRTKASRS